MHPRTPNYVLSDSATVGPIADRITFEAGTFVRPLELQYVPKHVLERSYNQWFDPQNEVFCYCSKGIFAFPKSKVREA